MEICNNFIDAKFKDNSPMETVEVIKNILKENHIEVEEIWGETKVPYCHALQLKIVGLNFSVSGKGLSREYALASAYGELIERVQLGFIGKRATQKDGTYSMNNSQDIKLSAKQLLEENMDIYQVLADRLFEWNQTKLTASDILMQYADEDNNVLVTPFVSLVNGKTKYFPAQMRKAMYTSNGCAAGNTFEEAIVQSISEIVERYYRLRIIRENISLPEIPEEELEKYKVAYKIISYIRHKGYKVVVKDCSLGEKFPVLCVCYVHTATGKYHTHFGAYPNFEIALTRALTETFQGRNLDSFANFSNFIYNNSEKEFVFNMAMELTFGTAKRLPEFFVGESKCEYNNSVGFEGENNKELLKECLEFFSSKGYDILVRNSSGLGFPTCQTIIPGLSETYIHRLSAKTDENRFLQFAVRTYRDPSKASIDDMLGTLMHNKAISDVYIDHPSRTGFLASAKIMADLSKDEESFLMAVSVAHIYYELGQYKNAKKVLDGMSRGIDPSKEEFLICTKRYLELLINNYKKEKIKEVLQFFHTPQTLENFYSYIDGNENPFNELVLHCDLKCGDDCLLKKQCYQAKAQKIIDLINQKTKELDFENFSNHLKSLVQ